MDHEKQLHTRETIYIYKHFRNVFVTEINDATSFIIYCTNLIHFQIGDLFLKHIRDRLHKNVRIS